MLVLNLNSMNSLFADILVKKQTFRDGSGVSKSWRTWSESWEKHMEFKGSRIPEDQVSTRVQEVILVIGLWNVHIARFRVEGRGKEIVR